MTGLTFDAINVYKGEIKQAFTVKANLTWDDYHTEGEEQSCLQTRMKISNRSRDETRNSGCVVETSEYPLHGWCITNPDHHDNCWNFCILDLQEIQKLKTRNKIILIASIAIAVPVGVSA